MNTHISKELAICLRDNGCKLEAVWISEITGVAISEEEYLDFQQYAGSIGMPSGSAVERHYPAYSWFDILVTHAKEFWGEREPIIENEDEPWKGGKCLHCGVDWRYQPPRESGCNHAHHPDACEVCTKKTRGWEYHTAELLPLIQENKIREAEDYVRKFSLFASPAE